jgi:hypothetical protein
MFRDFKYSFLSGDEAVKVRNFDKRESQEPLTSLALFCENLFRLCRKSCKDVYVCSILSAFHLK